MSRRIGTNSRSERTLDFDRAPPLTATVGHQRRLRLWQVTALLLGHAVIALAAVMALSS